MPEVRPVEAKEEAVLGAGTCKDFFVESVGRRLAEGVGAAATARVVRMGEALGKAEDAAARGGKRTRLLFLFVCW